MEGGAGTPTENQLGRKEMITEGQFLDIIDTSTAERSESINM